MTGFIYKNIKVELDGFDSNNGVHYGVGAFAMEDYASIMKNYIRPFDMLVGIIMEKEDTVGELSNFLGCMVDNPLNAIIMIDLSKVSIAKGTEFAEKIKAFFNARGANEDGFEWRDLESYEDRITYGLVNLID